MHGEFEDDLEIMQTENLAYIYTSEQEKLKFIIAPKSIAKKLPISSK